MGSRSGGGGGMRGGISGEMISKLANSASGAWGSGIDPRKEPMMLKGDYLISQTNGFYNPSHEKELGRIFSEAPVRAKNSHDTKYVQQYEKHAERIKNETKKVIHRYENDIPKANTQAMKQWIAKKIVWHQDNMKNLDKMVLWTKKKFG